METTEQEVLFKIPENWGDITIEQFQEFWNITNDVDYTPTKKLIKQLSVLSDVAEDYIYSLPSQSFKELTDAYQPFQVQPNNKFENIIEVDGIRFGFNKDLHQLTLGEWIDLETFFTTGMIDNLHKICAVLYRPIIEEGKGFFNYKIKPYKDIDFEGTSNLFRYNVNIQQVYGIGVFFWSFVELHIKDIHSSLMLKKTTPKQVKKAVREISKVLNGQIKETKQLVAEEKQKKKQMRKPRQKQLKSGIGNDLSGNSQIEISPK